MVITFIAVLLGVHRLGIGGSQISISMQMLALECFIHPLAMVIQQVHFQHQIHTTFYSMESAETRGIGTELQYTVMEQYCIQLEVLVGMFMMLLVQLDKFPLVFMGGWVLI